MRRGRCPEDSIHDYELESLPLFRKVVVVRDPVLVKNGNKIVRVGDRSKLGRFPRAQIGRSRCLLNELRCRTFQVSESKTEKDKNRTACIFHVHLDGWVYRSARELDHSYSSGFCVGEKR